MAKQELKQSTKPRLASDENNHKHIFFRNNKIVLSNSSSLSHPDSLRPGGFRVRGHHDCVAARAQRRPAASPARGPGCQAGWPPGVTVARGPGR
jgi:hypothetical protein